MLPAASRVPYGAVVHSADEAVAVAKSIDGPVALKVLGIPHKTDRGALRMNLHDTRKIRTAAGELLELLPEPAAASDAPATGAEPAAPGRLPIERFVTDTGAEPAAPGRLLIERFVTDTVAELIVGLHQDPQLGLLLTLGSGGMLVELVADTATLLLPVTEAEVRNALSSLKCAPLLHGFRGGEPADVDAAVTAVLAIARFAAAHADRLEELDVNPLAVCPRGRGAIALDALMRMREPEAQRRPSAADPGITTREEMS